MTTLPQYPSVAAVINALKPEVPVACFFGDRIRTNAAAFLNHFPGDTLYAVKCNPHPFVLKTLWQAGIRHFDTASLAEVQLVKGLFPDAHCYFMHPIKARYAIKEAYHTFGLRHFVVDHLSELAKISQTIPMRDLIIYVRMTPPSTTAVYDFSRKFGARQHEAVALLKEVVQLGATPAISFHIGSQCMTPETFTTTLAVVKAIVEEAGIEVPILDIGGGFPAHYDVPPPTLTAFFEAILEGVASVQKTKPTLLCEPGRALVVDAMHVIVQVQMRDQNLLYINDGVYGNFSEVWTGKLNVPTTFHAHNNRTTSPTHDDFTIYGPTCDSVDVLPITFSLPEDVAEGDWVEVRMIGAYSNAIASKFNGFYSDAFVEIV
jgi:ornithine decarboxylase